MVNKALADTFASRVIDWHLAHGRHDLPWQQTAKDEPNPYEVWVSEVMLQQTQVATVIDYFTRFMASFPTVDALAAAEWDVVAAHWAGLGYYARARNLHASAQVVAAAGYPTSLEGWQALKGIGRSTAGAIRAMGQHAYGVIMDGNVKRVLTRAFAIENDITKAATSKELWLLAEVLTPKAQGGSLSGVYAQAMMDLGATLCTRKSPQCDRCPLVSDCKAYALGRQENFPYKPKKAPTPSKQAQVAIMQHKSGGVVKWLWLKRPNKGLWGGLWCLPIFEVIPQALAGILPMSYIAHAPIKHTFTHFHWLLTPCVYELNNAQKIKLDEWLQADHLTAASEGGASEVQWLTLEEAADKGKPKAVLRVMATVEKMAQP